MEVANLTERKNIQPPVYGVKEFVCLSLWLSVANFDLIYILNNGHRYKNITKDHSWH